jgi:hypothetical protein
MMAGSILTRGLGMLRGFILTLGLGTPPTPDEPDDIPVCLEAVQLYQGGLDAVAVTRPIVTQVYQSGFDAVQVGCCS